MELEFKTLNTKLDKGNYYLTAFPKKYIFLHHIAGHSAESAVNWWNVEPANQHVAAPFLIEKDGTIYRTFDEKYWAYALGVTGATPIEKASIHIEIVAYGPLIKVEDKFYFKSGPNSKTEVPKEEVYHYLTKFRGNGYYHAYSKAQRESVIKLIIYLKEKFKIPMERVIDDKFCDILPNPLKLKPGLYSHTNVRIDKSDIHPQHDLIGDLISLHKGNYNLAL